MRAFLLRFVLPAAAVAGLAQPGLRASDHADPVAVPGLFEFFDNGIPSKSATDKFAGGITDLFVFPLDADNHAIDFLPANGAVPLPDPTLTKEQNEHRAHYAQLTPDERAKAGLPYELTAAERARIKALAVIFDVRRSLTRNDVLHLKPYVYRVYFDLKSRVLFDGRNNPVQFKPSELARYGGSIPEPEKIAPSVTLEFRLDDNAGLASSHFEGLYHPERVRVWTGRRHDPFIFPPFAQTDVVAMVAIVPMECFPAGQRDFLVWGTTSKNGKQIDHVGRSLRSQNPRFDMLNTLPPSQHVAAIREAMMHPSLMTDFFLKIRIQGMFQYRPWDLVPDVMIYSTRFNVGFPNGRRLTDDVASLLAQNGDTLLFELSYLNDSWPRVSKNTKPFLKDFPYLSEPNNIDMAPPEHALSMTNKVILAAILFGVLVVVGFAVYGFVHLLCRIFKRRPAAG